MGAIPRIRSPVFKGPAGKSIASQALYNVAQQQRTAAWSEWGALPDSLASLPGVKEDLARYGVAGYAGRWAPLNTGSFLWAVLGPGGWLEDFLWVFEVQGSASTSAGSQTGQSGSSSSSGLPPGAPPANQAPGHPLGRLRMLKRMKGVE